MEDKEYIEKLKKEFFNRYKDKFKWEKVKWKNSFTKEIYKDIANFAQKYNVNDNLKDELINLKNKYKKEDEFIEKLKENANLKTFLKVHKMEILWGDRELTEEIAPEIIEDFDSVKIKEGKIYITVALPLGPFFKDDFEEKFQKIRLKKDRWEKYIDYDNEGKGTLCHGIFIYDPEERGLEKECYNIKAFRGITYNEILTPIYNLGKSKFDGVIDNEIETISKNCLIEPKKKFLIYILSRIKSLSKEWAIKVRITKSGLVNIFFEREPIPDKGIDSFAEEKRKWMTDPYFDEELCNPDAKQFAKEHKLLKEEQIFSSYLNAAAIWITYIFLKECKTKMKEIFEICKETNYLKVPWNVRHRPFDKKSINSYFPPLRNYFFAFHLKDVKGIGWGDKIITSEEHFDCPADIRWCPKNEGDNCFVTLFGHLLLALSTNTYVVKDNNLKRPWFTQKELENFAKRDLSRWRGELCFIDSETILICTSSKIVEINKEGLKVDYDTYWKSIIKGLSLLVSCKTLAMEISRLLFEYIGQYRENNRKEEEMLEKLKIISHLLSRARFIATPSNISRARYIREKLESYMEAIGLHEIITNIEKDYDELNKAIHTSIESKRNSQILWLTFFLVPATILTAIGTVIMVCGIDISKIGDIINIICNETLKDYVIFALCVSFAFYIIFIGGIVLWKKARSIFKN